MRYVLSALLVVMITTTTWLVLQAQANPPPPPLPPEIIRLREVLNPEFPNWSPGYVLERVAEHLAVTQAALVQHGYTKDAAAYEASYLRFFDQSDVPRALLPAMTSALFVCVNETSTATYVSVPKMVPHTDGRLYYIDLRWYNWTPQVWEKISGEDPYFREPLVASKAMGLQYMKQLIGNGVFRTSWWLYYTFDVTQFLKVGDVQADTAFYYQLVYANATFKRKVKVNGKDVVKEVKGVPPADVKEFEEFWHVDRKLLKEFPLSRGGIVDEGASIVSYQNRVLERIRTALGVYWRSYDVFRTAGNQDYVETLFPKDFDGGEHIIQDPKGAQFYLLSNGKNQGEKRVEFGDPRLVRDHVSGEKAIVLMTKSCKACHAEGIIPVNHELPKLLAAGAKLNIRKDKQGEVEAFYLQNLNRLIAQDQAEHREFIKDCNGLTPNESSEQFNRARSWYALPVTLEQAAREIGCEIQELSEAIALGTKGRIGRLILDGKPIPRSIWERGGYQETFLLLLEYRKGVRIKK